VLGLIWGEGGCKGGAERLAPPRGRIITAGFTRR
jgi:hypothetical protein